jgi:lipoic acid synthetase
MGFLYAASGPLVRSSYKAAEVFLHGVLRGEDAVKAALDERLAVAHREAARVSAELGEEPANVDPAPALLPLSSLVRR